MAEWRPPDQDARDRIVANHDRNMLVEAGAGSGKTTAMVRRLVALILTGAGTIDQIVAVTFTRKAAAELRERFQEELEKQFRAADPTSIEAQRARLALDNLDSCFLGTIHAFCARLLRERPLEAGVPPDFTEVYGAEEELLRRESWNRFRERVASRRRKDGKHSRLLAKLVAAGIEQRQLFGVFTHIAENSDVRFTAPLASAPSSAEIDHVRQTLQRLLTNALQLLPRHEPEAGWDDLQKRVRSLRFSRDELKWDQRVELFKAALEAVYGNKAVVLNRWTGDKRHFDLIKDLAADWAALDEPNNPVRATCMRWLAYRYQYAIRYARAAAAFYAEERLRRGRLTFQDLLLRTAALLRDHPAICRELGERYQFLLIDEFQDTDPVQAEVLFRLAATNPSTHEEWLSLEPRDGALFVVGDPKQSIYRFRRADIALYLRVKQRFREFGEVVELTANFRSHGAIGRFVNQAFVGRFPAADDPQLHQATFAELRTKPEREQSGRVGWYRFSPEPGRGWIHIARPDSARIAPWIHERIASGERQPRDFLILTRTKHQLKEFAHALERNDVPYEISGAGIGVEEELQELILLLRALADPGNPVLTLAVLEGMFFGIDHDTLHEHALAGGHFHLLSRERSGNAVDEALTQLQRLWELARTETADVAIPLIVDELGILPYAASGELGATRAGALLFALDVLRQGCLAGRTTLAEAIELLESALHRDESDAPLMPGATNVVRVMNLHRAKGLEAAVVILANPLESMDRAPNMVQRRLPDGSAEGWFAVFDSTSRDRRKPIARPIHWDALEAEERLYQQAEEDRLLYVAATRAAEELIVARCDKMEAKSVWRAFHPLLDDPQLAEELPLQPMALRTRDELQAEPDAFRQQIEHLRAARQAQRRPAFRAAGVTARIKPDDMPAQRTRRRSVRALQLGLALDAPVNATTFGHDREGNPIYQLGLPLNGDDANRLRNAASEKPGAPAISNQTHDARGPEWGDAVHLTLHAAANGIEGDALRRSARNALLVAGCPADAQGEPLWLDDLLALVEGMRTSSLWARAAAAQRVLYEVPFEISLSPAEWSALGGEPGTAAAEVVVGRIDLAFEEPDGWVIADYKTDVVEPKTLRLRLDKYRQQVETYADCWQRISGAAVKEKRIVFTAPGLEDVVWT
jgi:ATP-dependent helicase/nuclease subunit A